MKSLFLFVFCLLAAKLCFSQQNFTLSGIVKDQKGEPLPGAGVYVSGYKIATATDNNGHYTLSLKPGNYDILVQIIGFKASNKNVLIVDKNVEQHIVLEESITQLSEVTIKPDPDRQYYIDIFKNMFIGQTVNAEACKIINPEILRVNFDKKERVLTVSTDQFLIIENKALGYRIKYLINAFEYDYSTRIVYYEGYPTYEDLKGSTARKQKWAKKRLIAYRGSPQHFFKSIFDGTSNAEGFEIFKLIRTDNTNRPSDSLINANIKRLTAGTPNFVKDIKAGDSLNKWVRLRKEPKKIAILNQAKILTDTLVKPFNSAIKSINFTDVLYVVYKNETESPEFTNRIGMSVSRPMSLENTQVSLINLQVAPVYFFRNGGIYNPKSMLYEGYWAWEKIADSVPMDYQMTEK
ncbi:carboxypeptidase-like regulatory domain-containing protein [Pedobacter sp. AW1-32]|uniref:carboxypeptidase-like regulatory domain-containing protein n=1 Tax=Pedobacter sp. AW1-32 TaxID=3383026 RepID=UPI003FEEB72F